MKPTSLIIAAIASPLSLACAQSASSNASAPSLLVSSNSSHEGSAGRVKCEVFGGLVEWFYDSYNSGPYECYGEDYESWAIRAAYRSGGTENVHRKYTDDANDPSCLNDWQWYAEDGKRLVTSIRGCTALEGATGRLRCALLVCRSGGVVGRQWKWCVC